MSQQHIDQMVDVKGLADTPRQPIFNAGAVLQSLVAGIDGDAGAGEVFAAGAGLQHVDLANVRNLTRATCLKKQVVPPITSKPLDSGRPSKLRR